MFDKKEQSKLKTFASRTLIGMVGLHIFSYISKKVNPDGGWIVPGGVFALGGVTYAKSGSSLVRDVALGSTMFAGAKLVSYGSKRLIGDMETDNDTLNSILAEAKDFTQVDEGQAQGFSTNIGNLNPLGNTKVDKEIDAGEFESVAAIEAKSASSGGGNAGMGQAQEFRTGGTPAAELG